MYTINERKWQKTLQGVLKTKLDFEVDFNQNTYYFHFVKNLDFPLFHKRLIDFFKIVKHPINIDVDSFLDKMSDRQHYLTLLTSLLSAHEYVYDIPFELKAHPSKLIKHNFLISKKYESILKEASVIIESKNFARKYEWMPANLCSADNYEKAIINQFKPLGNKVKIKVLHKNELIKKGMGLILGVGKASQKVDEPRIIVIEYNNNPKADKLAYIGKGILFDTGGVCLKTPPAKMQRMHSDMTGSAVVAGTIYALAKLNAKVNVVGILTIARNDIGSNAYVVQDILKSYEGTTVEVVNTDSEGRLVLSDGLAYAWKDLKAKTALTIGTVSGGTIYALGNTYTPIWFTNKKDWDIIHSASLKASELVWPMPFHEEYRELLYTSKMADISNTNLNMVASGCVSAEFMKTFKGDIDYIHCDIVGSVEYTNTPGPTLLRTLIYFAKEYCK